MHPCESGGIGRRTRLRIWRVKPWGFESPLSHQCIKFRAQARILARGNPCPRDNSFSNEEARNNINMVALRTALNFSSLEKETSLRFRFLPEQMQKRALA